MRAHCEPSYCRPEAERLRLLRSCSSCRHPFMAEPWQTKKCGIKVIDLTSLDFELAEKHLARELRMAGLS